MLRARLSARVQKMMNAVGLKKYARTEAIVGISSDGLKAHLEKGFKEGMTWEARHLWHIDHIRPCASFDLTDPNQQRACFHYTNLQPLWKQENQAKGRKYQSD